MHSHLYFMVYTKWNHFGVIGSGIRGPIAQGLERSADNGEVSRSSRLRPTKALSRTVSVSDLCQIWAVGFKTVQQLGV